MQKFDVSELYIQTESGEHHKISEVKEITVDAVEEENEKIRTLSSSDVFYATCDIDANSPFVREAQNHHKKYLRDKAQYKFWKDQEFVGNNRAGRRRKCT